MDELNCETCRNALKDKCGYCVNKSHYEEATSESLVLWLALGIVTGLIILMFFANV